MLATCLLGLSACGGGGGGNTPTVVSLPNDVPVDGSPATNTAVPLFLADFENGFPNSREWTGTFGINFFSPSGDPVKDGVTTDAAWTLLKSSLNSQGQVVVPPSGSYMYKGFIWNYEDSSNNHTPYPLIHADELNPAFLNYTAFVNQFYVYLDWEQDPRRTDWMHIATWGGNPQWQVVTLSVMGNRSLELGHTNFQEAGPAMHNFPLREWVRVTAYVEFTHQPDGLVYVWVNGIPAVMATGRAAGWGTHLIRAHWGLYTGPNYNESPNLRGGVQYNDKIQIWGLTEPLTDFSQEPISPYE